MTSGKITHTHRLLPCVFGARNGVVHTRSMSSIGGGTEDEEMEEIPSDMERPGVKRQASPKGLTSKKKKETELSDLSRRLERLEQLEKDNSALIRRNELLAETVKLCRFLARKEADESVFTTVTGRSQPAATMIPTRNRYEVPGGSERNLEGGEEQDNQQSQPVASDKATKRRYVAPVYVKQGARRLNDLLSEVNDLSGTGKFRITSVGQGQVPLTADTTLVRHKIREVWRSVASPKMRCGLYCGAWMDLHRMRWPNF